MALTTQSEEISSSCFYWTSSVIACLLLIHQCRALIYKVLIPLFVKKETEKGKNRSVSRNFGHIRQQRPHGPKKMPAFSNTAALCCWEWVPQHLKEEGQSLQLPTGYLHQQASSAFPNAFWKKLEVNLTMLFTNSAMQLTVKWLQELLLFSSHWCRIPLQA